MEKAKAGILKTGHLKGWEMPNTYEPFSSQ